MLIGLILKPFFILINFFIGLLGGFVGDIPFINRGFDVVVDLIGYGVNQKAIVLITRLKVL